MENTSLFQQRHMHVRVKFMNFVYNFYVKIPIYVNMFSLVYMKYSCATNKYI